MWVLTCRGQLLYGHAEKSYVTVEAFSRHLVTKQRDPTTNKRNLRLMLGYKIQEVTEDAYRVLQEYQQQCGHQEVYVRAEEGGSIGRVVQVSSKGDPRHPRRP